MADLASATGLNYATLKDMRTRCRFPKTEMLTILSRELNTTLDYLITGNNPEEHNCEEARYVQDHPEARAIVRLMMDEPELLPHISALVMAGRKTLTKIEGREA